MSPGVTFERIYYALKEQLGSGRYSSGEHLEPAALADDLCASITPVRDALHRLVGEGLVEAPRGDGFRTPMVTEVGLRHLYRWNAMVLDAAARAGGSRGVEPAQLPPERDDRVTVTEYLFLTVARISANAEHVATTARLNDRLRPIRRVELELLAEVDTELDALMATLLDQQAGALRRPLAAYHRRRERIVADIVQKMIPAS
jgi:DNA-binding transcriptional MocR family regulator